MTVNSKRRANGVSPTNAGYRLTRSICFIEQESRSSAEYVAHLRLLSGSCKSKEPLVHEPDSQGEVVLPHTHARTHTHAVAGFRVSL